MFKRSGIVLIAGLVIIAAVAFVWYSQNAVPTHEVSASGAVPETVVVQKGDVLVTVNATGVLQAKQTAALSFTVSGKVVSLDVDVDDHVQKGQIIATLDNATTLNTVLLAQAKINSLQVALHRLVDPPRQVDINVAKTALNLAQAQFKASQGSVDRLQAQIAKLGVDNAKNGLWLQQLARDADKKLKDDLHGRPQVNSLPSDAYENAQLSQKEFDIAIAQANEQAAVTQSGNVGAITAAQSQVVTAQNALDKLLEGGDKQDVQRTQINLKAAQVALDQAKAVLNKSKLIAPFDGVIGKLNLNVGEQTPVGPAAILLDTSAFYIDLTVGEVNIAKVTVGQEANLTFAALPGTVAKGKVTRIATSAQKNSGVVAYTVRVELDPADKPLLPSMTASLNLVTGKAVNVPVIPNDYVRRDAATGKTYAKVQQADGSFQEVEIGLGLQNDTVSEVKSGLNAGDVLALP